MNLILLIILSQSPLNKPGQYHLQQKMKKKKNIKWENVKLNSLEKENIGGVIKLNSLEKENIGRVIFHTILSRINDSFIIAHGPRFQRASYFFNE